MVVIRLARGGSKKQQLLDDLREAEELSDEARARTLRQQLNALIKENA